MLRKIIRLLQLFTGVIVGALLLLNFWITQTSHSTSKEIKGVVVYAKRDVPAGHTLTKDDIDERMIEKDRIPEDVVTSADDVRGKIAAQYIGSGQLISRFDLSRPHSVYVSPPK
jgi:flagella basal body P-ring formation protein FlgA